MALSETLADINYRLGKLEKNKELPPLPPLPPMKKEKKYEWKIKIPGKVAKKAKQEGVFAVLMLTTDNKGHFTNGYYSDGLILVDGKSFAYEEATVFYVTKKKIPLLVYYDWRFTAVGGKTEETRHGFSFLNEDLDHEHAEKYGLTNYGQKTIIRAIMQAQLPEEKKKWGGMSPLMWLFLGVGIIYVLSQMFGGG